MQREEPAACLVNAFSDEVSWVSLLLVYEVCIFEWVVNLGIRHSTRVKPHVNEVKFTSKHAAILAHEFYFINVGAVYVDTVVVLVAHVTWHETFVLQRIALHHASSHCLLYLVVEFLKATYAYLLSCVAIAPYRKRRSPVAGA